jgi:glycosyltransferase involved in cell wall biosynthesis
MKLLLCHNHYQQKGGEDQVFAAESALLESRGHQVIRHTIHNDAVAGLSLLRLAIRTVWSSSSYRAIRALIRRERPDVVHFYNTFPLLSPSVYYAARAEGRPVVQSLHNYRLMCANASFFRSGRICEDCLGKFLPLDGLMHRCYRGSRAATLAVTAMLVAHRLLRTWSKMVDIYLAGVTDFSSEKFVEGGIPAAKLVLKPNFVFPDPGPGSGKGGYALFIGRLVHEKGVEVLLDAWKRIGNRVPLKIIGDGPLAPLLSKAADGGGGITWLGSKSLPDTHEILKEAAFLVFPSIWYEALPRTIVDSFAVGTPVLASDVGAMSRLVADGRTGRHFRTGDPNDLAEKALWLAGQPKELAAMRSAAREEYRLKYTAERNYGMLMDAYQRAIREHKS